MAEQHDTPPVAVALEHMTGPSRGSLTWLSAQTMDVTLDNGCLVHITEATPGSAPEGMVARLHRSADTYEVEAPGDSNVWVNGNRITVQRLKHGDTVEFGDTGPLCRCRFYSEHSPLRASVTDILADVVTYLKVSRQPLARRLINAFSALCGRLSRETSVVFRITVLAAIAGFAFLAYQQQQLNARLQQDIDSAAMRLERVSTAVSNARKEALQPGDLASLRESLQQRLSSNVMRLEELEQRSTAAARTIAESRGSVAFILGSYVFRETDGDRLLRHVVDTGGMPLVSPRGRPLLSLAGTGPVADVEFTGTGFFVGSQGLIVTNRHVALPWEQTAGIETLAFGGVRPVMAKFLTYVPGEAEAVPVRLLLASDRTDLALLERTGGDMAIPGLELASRLPAPGEEVVVMGYPTGLRSMLAQSGAKFVEQLQESNNFDFWNIAAKLAAGGHISPLASRGIVGQVTPATIVYDAETTHGGSGGPVLDIEGNVVAVNSAILPEFGGSNLGVPIAEVQTLLSKAGLE